MFVFSWCTTRHCYARHWCNCSDPRTVGGLLRVLSRWRPGGRRPAPGRVCGGRGLLRRPEDVGRAWFRDRCGGRLVVLGTSQRPGVLRRAFDAGALGFVDKNSPSQQLIAACHTVAKGERFLDERLTVALLEASQMPLTTRELNVVCLAAQGAPIAEIATCLHLSRGTVRNYMASAIRKLGARNRVDAIRIVQSAGWT